MNTLWFLERGSLFVLLGFSVFPQLPKGLFQFPRILNCALRFPPWLKNVIIRFPAQMFFPFFRITFLVFPVFRDFLKAFPAFRQKHYRPFLECNGLVLHGTFCYTWLAKYHYWPLYTSRKMTLWPWPLTFTYDLGHQNVTSKHNVSPFDLDLQTKASQGQGRPSCQKSRS